MLVVYDPELQASYDRKETTGAQSFTQQSRRILWRTAGRDHVVALNMRTLRAAVVVGDFSPSPTSIIVRSTPKQWGYS